MVTMDDVARMVAALPSTSDGERHGNRTWFVNAKAFAWDRPFSKADLKRFAGAAPPDGPILAVAVADLSDKEAALAAHPKSFFTIPHFNGYAAVLIQLKKATKTEVRTAVVDGWLARAPKDLAADFVQR